MAYTVGIAIFCPAGSASAAQPLELGLTDPSFMAPGDSERNFVLDRARDNAGVVLSVVDWSQVAPSTRGGLDASNPGDPKYNWTAIDQAVRGADARGLKIILTVTRAPTWAEGGQRPASAPPGTWKPRSGDVRDFATAIARRYAGDFVDPDSIPAGPLPRVRLYQAWTEPNLSGHLNPQSNRGKSASPEIYRELLNAFYEGVERVSGSNRVVTAGTAPYGEAPGGDRVRPLAFWRKVMCLKGRRKLKPTACPKKPRFDVLAHHPINTSGPPSQSALHPDDVSSPDMNHLLRVLRKAEKKNRIMPGGKHPLWATEFWWRSKPPQDNGYSLSRHAKYIAETLQILWKDGVTLAVNLRVRDVPANQSNEAGTGLFFLSGEPKPAQRAFSFPLVVNRSRKKDGIWTRSPVAGELRFERKKGDRWKRIGTRQVDSGDVKMIRAKLPDSAKVRAQVGAAKSFVWKR